MKKSFSVECDTLDSILASHKVDVMKIDIEGAEILALKGATSTFKNAINGKSGSNIEDITNGITTSKMRQSISKYVGSSINTKSEIDVDEDQSCRNKKNVFTYFG